MTVICEYCKKEFETMVDYYNPSIHINCEGFKKEVLAYKINKCGDK